MAARRFASLRSRAAVPVVAALCLACGAAGEPPRHLLLITVDTLRTDRIGTYGARPDITPNLDGLAWVSTVFERAYAPAPFTLPSVSGILTGLHPDALGIEANISVLPGSVPTLATLLQRAGFRTGAVVSNFVLHEKAGLTRGFEIYDATFPQHEAVREAPERTAAPTTEAALATFDALHQEDRDRIFLWVHYQDPHGPYTPPPGFRERYLAAEEAAPDGHRILPLGVSDTGVGALPRYQRVGRRRDVAFYRAGYTGEVRNVDEQIGHLLVGLSERGVLDQTVVVFTADHGESLGEGDYWFAHGERLNEPGIRVPLFIRVPGRAAARRTDSVSLLDVVPTVAALFGIPPPPDSVGHDLLATPQLTPTPIYLHAITPPGERREALVFANTKYVVKESELGRVESLYADGDESVDLAAEHPAELEAMRRRLAEVRPVIAPGADTAPTQPLSPDERQGLRALGYLESEP